ncbi:MAG: hypothetical protein EOP59_03615 [Sphingomonadales bacterium]|nr:MAG: hypothetical protein EOP59_03615 [Sphingomonadales bacterium]
MQHLSRLFCAGGLAAAAFLAGCDEPGADAGTISVVANSSDTLSLANSAGVAPIPTVTATTDIAEIIKHDMIEPITAPPKPDPEPPQKVTVKPVDFTPPPLPPELLDDGGLKPLPTRRAQPTEPAK